MALSEAHESACGRLVGAHKDHDRKPVAAILLERDATAVVRRQIELGRLAPDAEVVAHDR